MANEEEQEGAQTRQGGSPASSGAAGGGQAAEGRAPVVAAATGHASFWPVVLAFAIAVVCFGLVTVPLVMALGALLIVVAAVGWGLERL